MTFITDIPKNDEKNNLALKGLRPATIFLQSNETIRWLEG